MNKISIVIASIVGALAIAAGAFAYSTTLAPAASGQESANGNAEAESSGGAASDENAEMGVTERFTIEGKPKGVDSRVEMITDNKTGHRYLVHIEAGRSSMVEIDETTVEGWGKQPYGEYKVDGITKGSNGVLRFVYTSDDDSMQYSCAPVDYKIEYDDSKDMVLTVYKFGDVSDDDAWRWPTAYDSESSSSS